MAPLTPGLCSTIDTALLVNATPSLAAVRTESSSIRTTVGRQGGCSRRFPRKLNIRRKISLKQHGAASGEPVLWLHGGMVAGWMWEPQLERLGQYSSWVPDLPGHGRSKGVPWISLEDTADLLEDACRTSLGGPRVHVVGLSLGAMTALHLAARHPERVASLTLSGSIGEPVGRWMGIVNKAVFSGLRLPGVRHILRRLLPPDGIYCEKESWRAIQTELGTQTLPQNVRAIQQRTLLLVGSREISGIKRTQRFLAQSLGNAEARVAPRSGHIWNGTSPDLFARTADAWISEAVLPEELLLPVWD